MPPCRVCGPLSPVSPHVTASLACHRQDPRVLEPSWALSTSLSTPAPLPHAGHPGCSHRVDSPAGDTPSRPDRWPALIVAARGLDPPHCLSMACPGSQCSKASLCLHACPLRPLSTIFWKTPPLSAMCTASRPWPCYPAPARVVVGFAPHIQPPWSLFLFSVLVFAASAGWVRDCFVWSVVQLEV